jgi:uncharacterized membrane-anchored protein YjiN (DUF445 family)
MQGIIANATAATFAMTPPLDDTTPAPGSVSARALGKRRQLRRMRCLASTLLCASLGLLLFSVRYQPLWPWLHWLQAFAEASAIGAIADWYAVIALFRRPLGLPIPHTAIIPRSKDSIGRSLGEFVSQYLLTPEHVVRRLERYDTAGLLAGWFAVPANAATVAASLASFIPGFLRAPEDADIRRFFEHNIAPRLLELDVARIAGRALKLLVDAGLHRAVLDRALAAVDGWVVANEGLIRAKFAEASKFTPAALDAYIVRKFMEGVRGLVHDVATHPSHALRMQFDDALRGFIRALDESPEHRDLARAWLQRLLENYSSDEDFRRLRNRLATQVESDLTKPDSVLRQYALALIVALAQGVLGDRAVLDRLNGAWLRFARLATVQHRGQVSALIAEVLKSWDANEVGRKIELEIGSDLQFIRINGALVGGMVGVALHACTLLLR